MKTLAAALLLLFAGGALAAPARGAEIAVALTDDLVEVDAGFAGARLVLFGALSGMEAGDMLRPSPLDIVAVVRGPAADFRIRPIERRGLIWTRGAAATIAGAPSILLTSATRPLEDIAAPDLRALLGLDGKSLDLAARLSGPARAEEIVPAFLALAAGEGRYSAATGAVALRKGALFTIDVVLPPTTPVGDYAVEVFLFRDGRVVSNDSASLVVRKVGIERRIYDLAHERPIAYGFGCVIIALLSGWLAALAFRK